MKRLILDTESKIHISDITEDNVIIIKRKGQIVGCIIKITFKDWFCKLSNGIHASHKDLSKLIDYDEVKDCEYYVLEEHP